MQRTGRGNDEAASAAWLEEQLATHHGLPGEVAKVGSLAILGTEPLFENGAIVGQKATQLEYPSKSAERIALSVASADLGSLWVPEGPYYSHQLYREIKGVGGDAEPPMEGLAAYQQGQVRLLQSYQYPLAEADAVLATHRQPVETHMSKLALDLEQGKITTWPQVIEQDLRFSTSCL